jgi:hypothetical protein
VIASFSFGLFCSRSILLDFTVRLPRFSKSKSSPRKTQSTRRDRREKKTAGKEDIQTKLGTLMFLLRNSLGTEENEYLHEFRLAGNKCRAKLGKPAESVLSSHRQLREVSSMLQEFI